MEIWAHVRVLNEADDLQVSRRAAMLAFTGEDAEHVVLSRGRLTRLTYGAELAGFAPLMHRTKRLTCLRCTDAVTANYT